MLIIMIMISLSVYCVDSLLGSACSSVGLGMCAIEHLSIESSVVDGSTIRVGNNKKKN